MTTIINSGTIQTIENKYLTEDTATTKVYNLLVYNFSCYLNRRKYND